MSLPGGISKILKRSITKHDTSSPAGSHFPTTIHFSWNSNNTRGWGYYVSLVAESCPGPQKAFPPASNEMQAAGHTLGLCADGRSEVFQLARGHFQKQILDSPVKGIKTYFLRE